MNTSIIFSSLKYLTKKYKLIVQLSRWVNEELININYNDLRFFVSLINKDLEVIASLIRLVKNKQIINNYLYDKPDSNVIKIFIDNDIDKNKLLIQSSRMGYYDEVKYLIDNGVDACVEDSEALVCACMGNHYKVAEFLIQKGANVNANEDEALLWSCLYRYYDIVKLLLDNGANKHTKDDRVIKTANFNKYQNILALLEKYN